MTKIDEATGLPELPDNHYWEIQENYIQINKRGEWDKWRENERYDKHGIGLGDNREKRTVTKTTGRFFQRTKEVNEYRYRDEGVKYYKRYGEWEEGSSSRYTLKKADPVTRENILERTIEVYNEWQEKVEREKLYGTYPPNKL